MEKRTGISMVFFALLSLGALRCEDAAEVKEEISEVEGKAEAWNYENSPDRFNVDIDYTIAQLPMEGSAEQMPWSETWWPMREDGFNQRWQGSDTLSPLEKYDVAFNDWTPPEGFMDLRPFSYPGSEYDEEYYEKLGPAAKYESRNGGNARARNGTDDDGDGDTDESDDWDGLGSWWGKCHMWSAVSIVAPEPQRGVEYNGVRFEYSDITALVMETYYNRTRSYMLGGRCNEEEVTRDDDTGRPNRAECRDTNAGSFHVVVTNMLGRHGRAFVMDASSGFQVWNHPVTDFQVTAQEEVGLEKALELLDRTDVTEYPYNSDAKMFYEVRMTLGYATDGVNPSTEPHGNVRHSKSYHYLLELDGDGEIIGGEWIGEIGPDFFWLPVMSNYSRGGNPYVKFSNVEMLVEMATRTEEPAPVTGGEIVVENDAPVEIPDNDPDGVTSTIEIDDGADVGSLKVRVDISHSYVGDLTVELRHGGKTALLHNRAGGEGDNLREEYMVDEFIGAGLSGAWELFVADKANIDTGTLNSWAVVYVPGDGSIPDDTSSLITHESGGSIEIPDNDPAGIESDISVPETGTIARVIIGVDITHTYIGDLNVEIKHGGTGIVLHDRSGGSIDDIVKEFMLSDFNNMTVDGDWKLAVSDHAGRDAGTLNSWYLKIETE